MGTNYYWHEKPDCECCGRPFEGIHIGKSSMGWAFALHVYPDAPDDYSSECRPDHPVVSLDDWIELFRIPGSYIVNEYGKRYALDEFLQVVLDRKSPSEMHGLSHHAGPSVLSTHKTYDCITGYFK